MPKIKVQCTCGKEFERWEHAFDDRNPFDNICPDCLRKEDWLFATRMLKLAKFRCVKCGWKLKKKDCVGIEEYEIMFKCKCCGYRFELRIPEPIYEPY